MSLPNDFNTMEKGLTMQQAIAEANRCLLCHDAPCSRGCPANTDPGTFIRKLRTKNVTGAIRTIKQNNILGGACGVLCPTPELCEKECSATGIGEPIRIGSIQRALVEHSWSIDFSPLKAAPGNGTKVAVIGAGPAGLSCAAELAKQGFEVEVFEAMPEPGGVIRYGVPAKRFDEAFFTRELKDIEDLGVRFHCSSKIQGKEGAEKLLYNGFKAVFIGTGLWEAVTLSGKKDIPGLYNSVDFLAGLRSDKLKTLADKIDGKTVAVIGGGSVAMDCVESPMRLGAKDVYLIYRRTWAQMPAEEEEKIEAEKAGIQFLLLNQPKEYLTGPEGNISGIKLVRTRLGEPDPSGRRRPEEVPGSEWELEADIVVEAIGNKAEAGSPGWYPNVNTDAKDLIVVDGETGATNVKGIFAGGDIVRGPALVVEAVQDGKVAAAAIAEYLEKEDR